MHSSNSTEAALCDSPGDNLLAEFTSVVDAVQCAVAVQNELKARNADLPENRRMQFRIGINLGDVIEEGDGSTETASTSPPALKPLRTLVASVSLRRLLTKSRPSCPWDTSFWVNKRSRTSPSR